MTRSSSSTGGGPNTAVVSAIVVVVVALAAVVGVRALSGDDDETTDAAAPTTAETLSPGCQEIHAGHNTMSWNPTMADEMLDCAWPYDPFVSTLEGGEEDSALDAAPFEPLPYEQIWTAIGETGLGVCSVRSMPDPPADGFTFGFDYDVAEAGCPDATPTAQIELREYSTRPQRDAAAHDLAADRAAFVLGRWALAVDGNDEAQVAALVEAMTALGAVPVEA